MRTRTRVILETSQGSKSYVLELEESEARDLDRFFITKVRAYATKCAENDNTSAFQPGVHYTHGAPEDYDD